MNNIISNSKDSVLNNAECGKEAEITSNKKVGTSCAQKVEHCNTDSSGSRNIDDNVSEDIEKNIIPDDILFQDPPPREDCPLCMQPMPRIDNLSGVKQTYYQSCCGKTLCSGCANTVVRRGFVILSGHCAFCRVPAPDKPGENVERLKNRMNVGDAEAFYIQGCKLLNKNEAIKLLNRAAELGSCKADCYLAIEYQKGERVEYDMDKAIHHNKLAAIGGHEGARHNLAIIESNNGNNDQAIKHWIIAAKNGFDESLKHVQKGYKLGLVTKDEFANTLRAHQASQNEIKSEQRNRANDIYKRTKEMRQNIKENLFKEPPPKEDCPVCFLPMPHAVTFSGVYTRYHPCCGKRMCLGCVQSSVIEMHMGNLKEWCLFCRVPKSSKEEEDEQRVNKRLELNDAEAFFYRGCGYLHGAYGLPKDAKKALELWIGGPSLDQLVPILL